MKNNVQKLRIYRGMTQQELADKAEVSVDTIRRIETRNSHVKYSTKEKIADALAFDITNVWIKENV